MDGLGEVGLERLLLQLEDVGAGTLGLMIEESRPANPRHLARLCLQGARDEGWGFEQAWATAMARLQPSQAGGSIDAVEAAELREDRRLLEEDRPIFQAAYEGRDPTMMECAQRLAAGSTRVDEAFRPAAPTLDPVTRALLAA